MAGYRRRTVKGHEYWELDWRDATGKRHTQSLGPVARLREAEVRSIAAKKARELAIAEHAGTRTDYRFDAWCSEYLTWHRSEYPDSHWRIRQLAEDHLIPAFEALSLGGLTLLDVERWKRARVDAGAAPATVIKELRTLRAILNRAQILGHVKANVAKLVKEPRDVHDGGIRYFDSSELQRLYMAAEKPWHWAAWMLFAGTGMRRGEGMALKWAQVGETDLLIVSTGEERTKSGEARTVPLSATGRMALDFFRTWSKRSDLYVLPRVTLPSLSRRCAKCCQRAGLDGSLHTLRHTFISHLAMDPAIPIVAIKEWAGHSSISVTEKYMHLRKGPTDQRLRNFSF